MEIITPGSCLSCISLRVCVPALALREEKKKIEHNGHNATGSNKVSLLPNEQTQIQLALQHLR